MPARVRERALTLPHLGRRLVHLFYLHGFASSGQSSKAVFLAERLAQHGLDLHVPDFNAPDFSTLTTSRMVAQVERAIAALPPAPVVLIGSSLGAFVAWHVAARAEDPTRAVERLVLLAPALDFGRRRMSGLTDGDLVEWRDRGWREFFHYAYGEPRRVHYDLFADAQQYDSAAVTVASPVLVAMGRRDEVVPPDGVASFCARRPNVRLVWFDDEHQLTSSLEAIWVEMAAFLGLTPA
jgi:hypothetical protein